MLRAMVALTFVSMMACTTACSRSEGVDHLESAGLSPDLAESIALPPTVALFDLHIDPLTLAGQVVPVRSVAAQPPQALRFDLDIEKFLTPDTLQVAGIRLDGFEDVVVTMRQRHPFPAPDFSAGITAKNRADLGYTGRLFILSDQQAQPVGAGIVLDRSLVRAPHGWASPGDLLRDSTGLNATHYPYVLLVDEAINNREGISNGGQGTGNYDPALGGWQQANAGPNGNGWTGYDYLHGGQASLPRFVLRRAALDATGWQIRLAVVIQYTDPRGQGGPSRRFPLDPPDVMEFAYRLPYAALDVSQVLTRGDWQLRPDTDQPTVMAIFVRDWDAQATASSDANLSDEPDVSKVQPGAPGLPTVQFLLEPLYSGLQDVPYISGSGKGADWLIYRTNLVDQNQIRVPGVVEGLIVVTDPEYSAADRGSYHFGVDAETLVADATRRLEPQTVVPIRVTTAFDATGWATSWGDIRDEVARQIAVEPSGFITVASQFNHVAFDAVPGDFHVQNTHRGGWDIAFSRFDPTGDYLGAFTVGGTGNDWCDEMRYDSSGSFIVLYRTNSPSFDVDLQAPVLDLGTGQDVQIIAKYNLDGTLAWAHRLPQGTATGEDNSFWPAMELTTDDALLFGGYFEGTADFDPGPGVEERTSSNGGDNSDACLLRLAASGAFEWVRTWGDAGDANDRILALARLSGGGVVAAGQLALANADGTGTVDLDPTAGEDQQRSHSAGAPFYAKVAADGSYQGGSSWLHQAIGPLENDGSGYAAKVAVDSTGHIYLAGTMEGGGDFDPGPGEVIIEGDGFRQAATWVYSVNSGGDYRWAFIHRNSDPFNVPEGPFLINADGNLIMTGFHGSSSIDYDPGPGEATMPPEAILNTYIVSYTAAGELHFLKQMAGLAGGYLTDIYQRPGGALLVCGAANLNIDVDPTLGPGNRKNLVAVGRTDAYFMQLDKDLSW